MHRRQRLRRVAAEALPTILRSLRELRIAPPLRYRGAAKFLPRDQALASAATRLAPRTPWASARTRSVTAETVAAVGLPSPPRLLRMASTSAQPTTTPAA